MREVYLTIAHYTWLSDVIKYYVTFYNTDVIDSQLLFNIPTTLLMIVKVADPFIIFFLYIPRKKTKEAIY